jgi:hypothetical protein
MAAVPVTIRGVVYPLQKGGRSANDQPFACQIVGQAWITGLEVDVSPPDHVDPPPIDNPPPDALPGVTTVVKEPPATGGWGFFPEYGWLYSAGPAAGPKR